MKRILYLSCRAKSKASAEEEVRPWRDLFWSERIHTPTFYHSQDSETVSKQYYSDSDNDVKYGMANEMDDV